MLIISYQVKFLKDIAEKPDLDALLKHLSSIAVHILDTGCMRCRGRVGSEPVAVFTYSLTSLQVLCKRHSSTHARRRASNGRLSGHSPWKWYGLTNLHGGTSLFLGYCHFSCFSASLGVVQATRIPVCLLRPSVSGALCLPGLSHRPVHPC